MKKITLTQGKFAKVDDSDYEFLNKWKWCANKLGNSYYAVRNSPVVNGKKNTILMHRVIMDNSVGKEIDHIDSDGLNNQRKNLRVCTHSENLKNRKKTKNNKSGFKGVSWYTRIGKWAAFIGVNGKNIGLGYFSDKEDAYIAYCKACEKYHGKFSNLK